MIPADLKDVTILFVDDEPANYLLIQASFEHFQLGATMEHVVNSTEALARLDDNKLPFPDFIFIDRNLHDSELTGDQLAEKICEDPKYSKELVVCVMSIINPTVQEQNHFDAIGIKHFFEKDHPTGKILPAAVLEMIAETKRIGPSKKIWLRIQKQILEAKAAA